jgi:NADH-quinone oxidoreductase subunit L
MLEQTLLLPAILALFLPLITALLLAVVVPIRRHGWAAAGASVFTVVAALVAAAQVFAQPNDGQPHVWTVTWLQQAGAEIVAFGVRVDGTSASMLVIVTLVATCVQIFSLGYMKDEPRSALGRYFTYHSLFVFSMNLLVLAPNLLQFFLGWELVGLTSYLLIGFYYQKPSAGYAAVKAFWITRLADMGFLLGLLSLFLVSGGFDYESTLQPQAATVVTLCLFLAVMGKSAQFPLHVWLPNAMEGPTPVSALLHAATMVAAGVYLLVRAFPLFAQAPITLNVMLWVGSFTAVFAAFVAVVQTDIKRVLAYSTCSQLGYMVAAVGAGSAFTAYFHLTTHAFFKALLFLAAGSTIHAVHSNELASMGGLGKKMPITAATFGVGALALAGFPGLSGFFSKDSILEALAERGAWIPLILLLVAAFLTAFYMGRTYILAFVGEAKGNAAHAHESPSNMTGPLIVLGMGAIGIGWFGHAFAEKVHQDYHFEFGGLGAVASLLGLTGLGLAVALYTKRRHQIDQSPLLVGLASFVNAAYVDRLFVSGFRGLALPLAKGIGWFDRYVVDGFINLTGWLGLATSRQLKRLQTGNTLDYIAAVVIGTIIVLAWGVVS